MATPTRLRQLIGGVWKYATVDEDSGGGGGSSSVKWVDLGLVDAAALAVSGRRTLYTTGAGEFLSALRFGDTVVSNDGVPVIVFEIGGLSIATADDAPYGEAGFAVAPIDSYARGIVIATYFNNGANREQFRSPGLQTGAFTATLAADSTPSHVLSNPSWQANHAYAATTAIIAAGHYWDNGGAGTSGGSTPNFAGHISGSVVDGTLTWYDEGAVATQGSVHAYAEIVTPAVP
jgi:hypothetical protein